MACESRVFRVFGGRFSRYFCFPPGTVGLVNLSSISSDMKAVTLFRFKSSGPINEVPGELAILLRTENKSIAKHELSIGIDIFSLNFSWEHGLFRFVVSVPSPERSNADLLISFDVSVFHAYQFIESNIIYM